MPPAVLLFEDALPLCLRGAAALCSEELAKDLLGDAGQPLALVLKVVQGQLGQPALDALGFRGELPDLAGTLGAVLALRAEVAETRDVHHALEGDSGIPP